MLVEVYKSVNNIGNKLGRNQFEFTQNPTDEAENKNEDDNSNKRPRLRRGAQIKLPLPKKWGAYGKAVCRFWPLFCRFIGEELGICRFIGEEKTLRCRWLSCFCSVYRWKNRKRAVFRWLPNTSVSENWLSLYMNNQKSKAKIFFARFARRKQE